MGPPPHTVEQLLAGLGLAALAILAFTVSRNRVIRRRMVFTLVVVAALVAAHFATDYDVIGRSQTTDVFERLLLWLAGISAVVALVFNPWFADRVRDGAPAIVQDALVTGLFLAVGMFLYQEDAKLFATSAIAAAVLGFALQETLGNAFAGLAIQTEKPFRVGHWVSIASHEGRVAEVTWRATKIRTKSGNLVTLPNNVVAREPITNYTEPAAPTRLSVDVGAGYEAPPNHVREAIFAAIRRSSSVLDSPKPDVLLIDFAGSSINYRARFWIDDFEKEEIAKDEVRRAIYYEFARRKIEIPWPIQVEYSREETHEPVEARRQRYLDILGQVQVFAGLPDEGRLALAAAADERLFGADETIVKEGGPGASMFVVCRGQVAVTVGARHEVARIGPGGYFGEMSLLTGEARSATVTAVDGDCTVLEVTGEVFKEYVAKRPDVIDQLAEAAAERRRELDRTRAAVANASQDTRLSLADRMRRFFGLK